MSNAGVTSVHPGQFVPSHDSAICFIPPGSLQIPINTIRALYDKAFGKWPPHVNLLYPFVKPDALDEAAHLLCQIDLATLTPKHIRLHQADFFTLRGQNTISLRPQKIKDSTFAVELVKVIRQKLGWPLQVEFEPHLTIGQSISQDSNSHGCLIEKARLLAPLSWELGHLAILVRDLTHPDRGMRLWGRIEILTNRLERFSSPIDFHMISEQELQGREAYSFQQLTESWHPGADLSSSLRIGQLIVASYNVLAEFEWPPQASRYPLIVSAILSKHASSDVLVLQEVTDHFLPYLLHNPDIGAKYPYCTHGGSGPLPSLLNIVVFSKLPFSWEYVSFARKHKGAAVLKFVGSFIESSGSLPIVLAACHLTHGLTDDAIIAKRNELSKMLEHLSAQYPGHPWIVAGDFNLATSSFTIDQAREKGHLSSRGHRYLREMDELLADHGFHDAWLMTRLRSGVSQDRIDGSQPLEELHEGEQGATFDPLVNHLAMRSVGSGLNDRPQRYDRIFFNNALSLDARGFNIFGKPISENAPAGSDHWGIRCFFGQSDQNHNAASTCIQGMIVKRWTAPPLLSKTDDIKNALASLGCLPTDEEQKRRIEALRLLERSLCRDQTAQSQRPGLDIIVIPVGSYGLGVWSTASDVDCLCVGRMSSKNFFSLALPRLRKARSDGIQIMRTVQGKAGMMLEVSVMGIMFDLQYCAAAIITERYPNILNHPATDRAFDLPAQTLVKLKAARDLAYLKRSIPDMAQYRLAHLLIKTWAKSRGLYSAKYGLLGGINISVMLVPICKFLACNGGNDSTADILCTFFQHYADFDWGKGIVFDPWFHQNFKYHRTLREPLCLIGWHAPSLNTALSASVSTVRTLGDEFSRARNLLSQASTDWNSFLSREASVSLSTLTSLSAADFLCSFKNFIRIDARYWGTSPEKGRKFIGWLESRCITVLIDVNRRLPNLITRIWPGRFIPAKSHCTHEEYCCSFLIGLIWESAQSPDSAKDSSRIAEQALHSILRDFENRTCGDQRYFDQESCWVLASVASGGDNALQDIQFDSQSWTESHIGDTDPGEDFETDEEDESSDEQEPTNTYTRSRDVDSERPPELVAKPTGSGKLRSAADVMSRLRWDPGLDSSDYLVGYEDRFTGAQERALEQWKTEQTDEEFIPQHRILYFKKKSDGLVVWDRRRRIDSIFGSGWNTVAGSR